MLFLCCCQSQPHVIPKVLSYLLLSVPISCYSNVAEIPTPDSPSIIPTLMLFLALVFPYQCYSNVTGMPTCSFLRLMLSQCCWVTCSWQYKPHVIPMLYSYLLLAVPACYSNVVELPQSYSLPQCYLQATFLFIHIHHHRCHFSPWAGSKVFRSFQSPAVSCLPFLSLHICLLW